MKNISKLSLVFGISILFITIIVVIINLSNFKENTVLNSILNETANSNQNKIINSSKIKTLSDGTKYLVDPSKILDGGPPKDGIPSIDKPLFVSVKDADNWIKDDELVLVLQYKGIIKVYPLQIMVWHEIVNDVVAGDALAITYCPLCGSGIAYKRNIDGSNVEFGTSGKLYNSNLVMYDRKTDTYWTQIDGRAIMGELTGKILEPVSIDTVVWKDLKLAYPNSKVLSKNTGFNRQYGKDPYGNYYENSFLIFPVENSDDRISAKTVVYGIKINNVFKAYQEKDLIKNKSLEDLVADVNIIVSKNELGIVKIIRKDTGKEIIKERDFWFAWYAFHPNTLLFIKK